MVSWGSAVSSVDKQLQQTTDQSPSVLRPANIPPSPLFSTGRRWRTIQMLAAARALYSKGLLANSLTPCRTRYFRFLSELVRVLLSLVRREGLDQGPHRAVGDQIC